MTTNAPPPPPPVTGPPRMASAPKQVAVDPPKFSKPKPKKVGQRIVLYGVNGFGKTAMSSHAPKPLIIEVGTESGYTDLYNASLVPEAVATAEVLTWPEALAAVQNLPDIDYKTVVIDALSGLERLLKDYVLATDFKGDDSTNRGGFNNFGAGYKVMASRWSEFVQALDKLRANGKHVILVGHAIVKGNRDPDEADYDQYIPDLHRDLWAIVNQWAGAVLFGKMRAIVDNSENKPRAVTDAPHRRVIYCTPTGAVIAKNRHNMPSTIDLSAKAQPGESDNPTERAANRVWRYFFNAQ